MKKVFLIDESMVKLLHHLFSSYDLECDEGIGLEPMYLLLAISDYCLHGYIRDSLQDEPMLQTYIDLLKEKLDLYMATLREKGIIDEEG